jgi:Flp pilus assembly protein TadG
LRFARGFQHNNSGNIAVIFALALILLLVAAVDYSRALSVKASPNSALDAGVLAIGSRTNLSDTEATKTVKAWLDVHMTNSCAAGWTPGSLAQASDGTITARASVRARALVAKSCRLSHGQSFRSLDLLQGKARFD